MTTGPASGPTKGADGLAAAERRALESEIATLRERLHQREAALMVLNRRLVSLERFDEAAAGEAPPPATAEADLRARAAEAELERLRHTRTFRYTAGARRLYGAARRLGSGR